MYSKHNSNSNNVNTNLIKDLLNFSPIGLTAINELLSYANLYEIVHPAQETIAKKIGTTRKTINRVFKLASDLNLFHKTNRLWNTCIYQINPDLNDPELRWLLRDVFKAFKQRPLVPLLIIQSAMLTYKDTNISFHKNKLHHRSLSYPSSLTNTCFNNNNTLTYEDTTTVEEQTRNVKNYKVEVLETNNELNSTNSYKLKKDVVMLQKIKEVLGLGDYETNQLSNFDDKVLTEAFRILNNKKDVSNRFRFLLGCCNKINIKTTAPIQKTTTAWSNTDKTGFYDPLLTAEDVYNELVKLDSHDASKMFGGEGYGNRIKKNWADREFITTDNDIEFIKLIDSYRIRYDLQPRIMSEIKPESTELNESTTEQPNPQQNKKSSTDWKFEAISKYRKNENFEQIRDFINGINYEPSNEEEDFDSPLIL